MKSFLCLLGLAGALGAADLGKRYLSVKDDSGLFVGEGVAELKEAEGDGLKALALAKKRAAGALAEAVRVRVKAEFSEKSDSAGGQTVTSQTETLAEVLLEGVRYDDFVDFPEKGRITVLAWVTKEQYRRTLAGKSVPVYRPELGLTLGMVYLNLDVIQAMIDSSTHGTPLGINAQPLDSNNSPNITGLGLDLMWRGWIFGVQGFLPQVGLYEYGKKTGMPSVLNGATSTMSIFIGHLGYEYTPWAWRVQPYVPMGVEAAQAHWQGYGAMASGAFSGLGLRFWPNDSLALDLGVRYHFPLGSQEFNDNGRVLQTNMSQDTHLFRMQGYDARVAIQWSGF